MGTSVASSSTDWAFSSLGMNFSSEYHHHIPFYEPNNNSMAITTTTTQAGSNNNNLGHALTPFTKPFNEVRTFMQPKQPPSHSMFNLNFNVEGLQNSYCLQYEQQAEGSLKNPYQDYIDSLYRCYQGSDMVLH